MAVVITSCMPWKRCLYFEESHKANLCQHFICKHSLWNLWFNSFILYYLVTPWLERRFRQGETLTSEDCHLVFSPLFFFLMHCGMVLIIYYLEELKRVFTKKSTPRDMYRDEGKYLSQIQVPKSHCWVCLSNTVEPRWWHWASKSSNKCISVAWVNSCRRHPSQSLNYSSGAGLKYLTRFINMREPLFLFHF